MFTKSNLIQGIVFFVVFLQLATTESSAETACSALPVTISAKWEDMTNGCINAVRQQIQAEINASMAYLSLGAHFSKDTVNRPGFSSFFFGAAGEEREHAMKLIEYLLMRGSLKNSDDYKTLIKVSHEPMVIENGLDALQKALEKEASVTKSIKNVIAKCENDRGNNDYHLVDYLTGVYLEEQYNGQRALAGKISTLGKMMKSHGALGEFLFDKKHM